MNIARIILGTAATAFCWSYNGGGNMTSFEKADAVYRKTPPNEYHAGMIGKFYINPNGKPTLTFGHMHVDKFKSWSGTVDGIAVTMTPTGSPDEGTDDNFCGVGGLGGDFRVRKMEVSMDPNVLHTKASTATLAKALLNIWGYEGNMLTGSSSSFACGGSGGTGTPPTELAVGDYIHRGSFSPNTGTVTATVRDNILNEGFVNIARAAHTVNLGWTGPDLVDYVFYWVRRYFVVPVPYTYFRDLYDAEDTRCDFLVEWSYEKSGVPVWGKSPTLKWVNGGSTGNAEYHNDFINFNDDYTLEEYSALIESGDFSGNGRNAQTRTTMRPSIVIPPFVRIFQETSSGPKVEIEENASTYVYYSIELFNTTTGAFVGYAKDANNADYKYRQLYLSQDLGASRMQVYYPTSHPSQNWGEYTVKIVVTDEGANTTEKTYTPLPTSVVPPAPVLTQLSPSRIFSQVGCFPGTLMKVYGSSFDPDPSKNLIQMNGATVIPVSSGSDAQGTWLGCYAPNTVRPGDVKVLANGKLSNALPLALYPRVLDVSGKVAAVGELVTITGIGFHPPTNSLNIIYTNTGSSMSVPLVENTETRVSFIVPDGAISWLQMGIYPPGYGPEMIQVPDFLVAPTITSATQYPIRGGNIRITGTGFTSNSIAMLGGVSLATTFVDLHTLMAKVPADFPLGIEALRIYTREVDASDNCGPLVLETKSPEYNVKVTPTLVPVLQLLLQ